MPMYEYFCENCELETEHLQNINDSAPRCEICGHVLKKMISLSTFFLIGTGWSKDGYSKKKKGKETENV